MAERNPMWLQNMYRYSTCHLARHSGTAYTTYVRAAPSPMAYTMMHLCNVGFRSAASHIRLARKFQYGFSTRCYSDHSPAHIILVKTVLLTTLARKVVEDWDSFQLELHGDRGGSKYKQWCQRAQRHQQNSFMSRQLM